MKTQILPVRVIALLLIIILPNVAHAEQASESYQEIEWIALMPKDDLDALMNPPDYLLGIEDGSEQDSVEALNEKEGVDENTKRFQNALSSTRVIDTYADKRIRIPGFIVPLQSDDSQQVTEFFIVPYFGACLHMPPPPPNQIIHSKAPQGIQLDSLYDPFWFEGTLVIDTEENSLGTSAYRLKLNKAYPFEEE
ncbi:DUF3299 domain-containing protein [Paraglaciecola chathamensis]|jgi:hypothetical protein|uniref:DUF3299 domain-containing protein n=1 Tax=Paraglaciecola chathamensis TaxID=368405 RepID=UPI0026FA95E4|nr:DUF3299 domain-containing protein [Paraglaciecola chathamensis]MDO6841202.1 DUF3299 domain-containing protein [Paraglaciecola chathamensis]